MLGEVGVIIPNVIEYVVMEIEQGYVYVITQNQFMGVNLVQGLIEMTGRNATLNHVHVRKLFFKYYQMMFFVF